MSLERRRQVEELYHAALEREQGERAAFVVQAAAGDAELRSEVESLLEQNRSRGAGSLSETKTVTDLSPGAQLGPYRIESLLGAGGMGRVFKALDTRLNRTVAIKVCRQEFSERFHREARAIAALNHPHICTLYDVGPDYLVMEYVEGKALKGPLPLNKVLQYGSQICEALEAAHRKGVIHRDLKPSNILVTRSGVKVLDFGLAKMAGDETLTQAGAVMGTPAYMAPEQWEGKEADARSDIYALGSVIYEMATGERVPHKALEPAALDRVVKTCLAEDVEERWQSAREVKLALELARPSGMRSPLAPSGRARVLPWVAAALFAAGMLVVSVVRLHETPPAQQAVRFSLLPPENTRFREFAVSPDGHRVVFAVQDASGNSRLWVRPLDALAGRALAGTEGASLPFWSPDSRWIGFFAEGKLKKLEISGGPPQAIADAPNSRGGTWSRNGVIVFAPSLTGPLMQVLASGGNAKTVTEMDASHHENSHRWPEFLPDGRFLYFIRGDEPEHRGVYVGSLDSKQKTRLLASAEDATYGLGYLLFVRGRTLVAQRFDWGKLQLAGEAVPVAELGAREGSGLPVSLSETGVLVYIARGGAGGRLQWFERSGKTLDTVAAPPGAYDLDLSPDGRRLTTAIGDIWLFDLARGASTRLTFHPAIDYRPVWSPDGRYIAFCSNREGVLNLYRKEASGAGEEEPLLTSQANKWPTGWSPDGRWLLYQEQDPKTRLDLWVLALDRRQPAPWLLTRFDERNARFSPDGEWVAYDTDESGRYEVYVRAFSPAGGAGQARWAVSTGGGQQPRWRADGKEMFYLGPGGRMMAVEVKTAGGQFEAGVPRGLLPMQANLSRAAYSWAYAVTGDGQRFLIDMEGEEAASQQATVLLNWAARLNNSGDGLRH